MMIPVLLLAALVQTAPTSGVRAATAAVAAVEPDSTLVGEPFVLGVSVAAADRAVVSFPAVLPSRDGLEQLAAPEIARPDSGGGAWRAYYRMTAWRTGDVELPGVEVGLDLPGEDPATLEVAGPTLVVMSVLPPDSSAPDLRPARPPLATGRALLPWLLGALALALLLLLLWRALRRRGERGERPASAPELLPPAAIALAALGSLRERHVAGLISQTAFYDGLEDVLKVYLTATRDRRAGTPVRPLPPPAREPTEAVAADAGAALRRTQLVRFGRARLEDGGGSDAEACARWVEADRPEGGE